MKKVFKTLTTLLMTLFLVCGVLSSNVLAYSGSQNDQGQAKLTITNLTNGEQFNVWRIVDVSYDTNANNVTYSFNNDFASYFTTQGYTVEQFIALENDSEALNSLLSGLPAVIQGFNNIQPLGGTQTAANGKIEINNLKAGGYFVEPKQTEKIYQTMFIAIVPSVDTANYTYTYNDKQIAAKSSMVTVEKKVKVGGGDWSDSANVSTLTNDESVNHSQVCFKTTIGVPQYVTPISGESIVELTETLPDGLEFVSEEVEVYTMTSETDNGTKLDSTQYSLSVNGNTLVLNLSDNYYQNIVGKKYVRIEYCALVNSVAIAAKNNDVFTGNTCASSYKFSRYPYATYDAIKKPITASLNLYTYGLEIDKYAVNSNNSSDYSSKLGNAEFALYRATEGTETPDKNLIINNTSIPVVQLAKTLTIKTTDDGKYQLSGLATGTYYLVETKAPTGYALNQTPVVFDVVTGTDTGYTIVHIGNSVARLALPQTGATGMVAFTIVGLGIMAAAIVILVSTRRNKAQH